MLSCSCNISKLVESSCAECCHVAKRHGAVICMSNCSPVAPCNPVKWEGTAALPCACGHL